MSKPLPSHGTDPIAAKEVLTRLIPSSATRRAVGRLVAEVADALEGVAPSAWELTLRRDNFFLNVGQVAVLTAYRDVISLYTEPLPRKPARLDSYFDGKKEGVYKAVRVPAVMLRMSQERVTSVEPEIVRAFRAFVVHAANAKSASPWRTSHSPAAIDVLARAGGRRIAQPGYYVSGATDDEDTTTNERDLAAELASSREVEQAAIRVVTDRCRTDGWSVTSREAAKVGYDLFCKRGRDVALKATPILSDVARGDTLRATRPHQMGPGDVHVVCPAAESPCA